MSYKPYFKRIVEEDEEAKSKKAIQDLITLDWESSEENALKALAIIEGLFHANTDMGKKFIKDISDYTSGLKIEKYTGETKDEE